MGILADSLFLPALMLAVVGYVVPRLVSKILPEGVIPLLLNAFLSTVILFVLSAGFFMTLYIWQGAEVSDFAQLGWGVNAMFFGRLGLIAGLIWAPIMLLSVAGLPRKWETVTW